MGLSSSKVECIWLPGQSGKTRNVIGRMKALEEVAQEDYDCEGFVNIVISANNRSLVDQTEVRMNKELFVDEENEEADANIEGTCFSWRSGLKNNNISVSDLTLRILEEEVTMVVCCAHSKRLNYLFQLIKKLETSRFFSKKINLWIDEADASINLWSKPELDITSFSKVNKVTLVSASYDSILKKFGKIRVLPCLETMLPIYHRLEDCIRVEEDIIADSAPEYLRGIFDDFSEMLCKPGVCLFAPGDVERVTHEEIAEFLYSKGFAVVIINGNRKEVLIPGKAKPISLTNYVDIETGAPEEIGRVIAKIYQDNHLSCFPFAITGHLCLGRGITFQNDKFLFTHGILFNIKDKANAYQTACRLAGNIKGLPDYCPSMLFTTSKMMKVILQKEDTAVGIARYVAENNISHVDRELIQNLYEDGCRKKLNEEDFVQEWFSFATFKEAKIFSSRIKDEEDENGFRKCTYDTKNPIIMTEKDLLRIKAGKKTAGTAATNLEPGKHTDRLYTIYSDISDKDSAIYYIRRITRKATQNGSAVGAGAGNE